MKFLLFALGLGLGLAAPLPADDHARGLQLLKEGKFAEAAAAFRAAAEADPDDARVHYNLALALWRAGDAHGAEIAAEKAATLSDGRLAPLRDGILGNLKVDEAKGRLAGETPDLQAALAAAQRARDHYLHGAVLPDAPAELARNLERTLQLIAEIENKIEEQKRQQEEQKKDEQEKQEPKEDEKKDEDKEDKKDESKSDQQKDGQEKQDDQSQEGKQDEQKPQPDKPQGRPEDQPPEPKPQPQQDPKEGAPEPKPGDATDDKPEPKVGAGEEEEQGEKQEGQAAPPPEPRELSPEETKRLLDLLARLHAQQAELEKARAAARPKVKKDW